MNRVLRHLHFRTFRAIPLRWIIIGLSMVLAYEFVGLTALRAAFTCACPQATIDAFWKLDELPPGRIDRRMLGFQYVLALKVSELVGASEQRCFGRKVLRATQGDRFGDFGEKLEGLSCQQLIGLWTMQNGPEAASVMSVFNRRCEAPDDGTSDPVVRAVGGA
jgi:hypothetical protein